MKNLLASNFELIDQEGNKFNLYENLKSYVMLVFYPKDETPVCTKQLINYSENFLEFEKRNIKVVAINKVFTCDHKAFSENHNLKIPILNDKSGEVSRLFDAINIIGQNKRKIVLISPSKEIIYQKSVFPLFYVTADKLLNEIKEIIK